MSHYLDEWVGREWAETGIGAHTEAHWGDIQRRVGKVKKLKLRSSAG